MTTDRAIQLPTEVWQHIVRLGLEQYIQQVGDQLQEAEQEIAKFEQQFGMSFDRLQEAGLPQDAGLETHEAYVEWSSWQGYQAELHERLEKVQAMLEPTNA